MESQVGELKDFRPCADRKYVELRIGRALDGLRGFAEAQCGSVIIDPGPNSMKHLHSDMDIGDAHGRMLDLCD